MNDKIEVCIPTYNRKVMLERLIKSIPQSIKVNVSDNGAFVTNQIQADYNNVKFSPTLEVVDIFHNWNRALELSDAEYVVIPSDDDLYLPDAFDTISAEIEDNPQVDMFVFGHHLINELDHVIGTWCVSRASTYRSPYGFKVFEYGIEARMPSIVLKKSFLDRIGLFDTKFKLTAADSELIQRALLLGTVKFIPQIISCYRTWNGGLTSQKQASQEWLNEIKYWTDKITVLAKQQYDAINMTFNSRKYVDEILARNILAGMYILLSKNKKKDARDFLSSVRVPRYCSIITRIKLYRALISSYL